MSPEQAAEDIRAACTEIALQACDLYTVAVAVTDRAAARAAMDAIDLALARIRRSLAQLETE